MAYVVETAFDVPFKYPFGRYVFCEYTEALFPCIERASFLAEPVGVVVGCRFSYRLQCHQIQRLHSPVFHGRNTQRPLFAVLFADIDPFQRLGIVSPAFQFADCLKLRFWGFP